jgi:PAS domain S-box-containing protein
MKNFFGKIKKFFEKKSDKMHFINVLNCFTEPVLLSDLSGNILYNNDCVNELFGYENLVDLNVDILIPDSVKHKHSGYIKQLHKDNINTSMTKRNVKGKTKDGDIIDVLIKLNLIKLDNTDYILVIINKNTQLIKFDTFFNSSLDLFSISKGSNFLHVNHSFYNFFDDPSIYNKTFLEYVHPDDIKSTINEIDKLNNGLDTVSFTNRYLRKDNIYRIISWKATNIDGLIYAIARDITDIELMTNALSLSVEGISRIDKDGLYVYTNDAYNNICGYKPNELVGKHWNTTIHETEIDKMNQVYIDMKKTGKSEANVIGIKKNGDIFYKKITMVYINDTHFCFMKDNTVEYLQNTKIKNLQSLLLESEKLAKIGSWTWNINTNELIWTDGLKEIYNFDKNESITFDKYMSKNHPDDQDFIKSTINTSIENKSDYTFTHRLKINDAIKYLYSKGRYIKDTENEFIIGCGQDITETKKIELDLIKSKDLAEQASKMKSLFVANMSHEIRTPINGIVGMATLLKYSELNDEQKDFIEIIISSSGTLLSIINNVLDFAKIETGKIIIENVNNVNIREIVNDLFKINKVNQILLKKDISFTFKISDNVPNSISIDSNKLIQVLTNLLNNSIKFTEYGSIILLVKQTVPGFLNFEIKDTGIGINESVLGSLFKPFEQGDQSITKMYGGTGLGLAICKNIINMMGGEISIISTENIGTSVNFTIAYTLTSTETQTQPQLNDILINEKYVVIVEDNKTNQIVLQKMLNKAGYTNIITYNNGLECVNNINKIKEQIGLIFMDIHMPQMDGYTATIKLREYNIKSSIIACTANAMTGEKDKCKEYGMDDFLLKPYQYTTLTNLMTKYFKN